MYKVFIKDKRIVFTNNQQYVDNVESELRLHFFSPDLTTILLDLLQRAKRLQEIVIVVDDVENAFNQFKLSFNLIEAAGGVVKNTQNKTLFIYRLDHWDLPKGKIEKGEQIEAAAIREVEEECAVTGLKIVKPLNDSYHIYHLNDKPILKKTYWFEMQTDYNGELIPQKEEGIEKVEWFTDKQINEIALKNTYSSIAYFLRKNL
ncbi:MAG: NUDIX hydrolase [Flavobacteriales bacterium]